MQEAQETRVPSPGREGPLVQEMAPSPVFLPGKSHGQRSLAGCSPRGRRELDTIERTCTRGHLLFSLLPTSILLQPQTAQCSEIRGLVCVYPGVAGTTRRLECEEGSLTGRRKHVGSPLQVRQAHRGVRCSNFRRADSHTWPCDPLLLREASPPFPGPGRSRFLFFFLPFF